MSKDERRAKTRETLRSIGRTLKQELSYYRLLWKHPSTPRRSRYLLGLAIAYLCSPIDVTPTGFLSWGIRTMPSLSRVSFGWHCDRSLQQ